MLDSGVVVGYLAAALVRGARAVADQAVERLLDRLVDRVGQRLGPRAIDRLQDSPGESAGMVRKNIDLALRNDPAFAEEIGALVSELDRRGARVLVNEVQAHINVQAFDQGIAVGRDFNIKVPDPSDLSNAAPWIKVLYVIGIALAFPGIGVFVLASTTGPNPVGIAMFATGFVCFAIAGVGHSLSPKDSY